MNLSVVFIGTGEFGVPVLKALIADPKIKVPMVITGEDKPSGRGLKLTVSPIKRFITATPNAVSKIALASVPTPAAISNLAPNTPIASVPAFANKLIIQQPKKTAEIKDKIAKIKPDFLLVVSYGEIIGKEILALPRFGAINIHGSLLPKYRGASPIQEAILARDKETGVTWILMNEKMDQGDIVAQKSIAIADEDNFEILALKLAKCAAQNTLEILQDFAKNRKCKKQDELRASYCKKVKKEYGKLNPFKETAEQMMRKIRAYTVWPGCWITLGGKRVKIIQARAAEQKISSGYGACGGRGLGPGEVHIANGKILALGTLKGVLFPEVIQPEGKRAMKIEEFLKGNTLDRKLKDN